MHLIEPDILAKRPDFNRRAAGRALPRWKWELLDLVDGERSMRALADATGHDVDIVIAFADEMIAAEMIVPLTLSYGDFLKHRHDASPAAAVAAPLPAAPAPKKTMSLQERVAALKERALGAAATPAAPAAVAETSPHPPGDVLDFLLDPKPASEPPPASETIEFRL